MLGWGGVTCCSSSSNLFTMFISPSNEYDFLPQQPLKPSNGVGGDGGVGTAQMGRGIHVIKRSGEDKRVVGGGGGACAEHGWSSS